MNNEEFWRALLNGEKKGLGYDAARSVLACLAKIYSLGLGAYLFAESVGIRKRLRAPVPVISIGNITVGGTGKTPMVELVARHFQDAGWRVAILSRGYRGKKEGGEAVVSDGEGQVLLGPAEAGDEASVLANALPGVPVLVGRDRRRTAKIAVERFQPHLLLLDDGLQYWQLARDLDIVLVDARCPFDNGYPLPRGLLREPKENIRRAGVIVATRSEGLDREQRATLVGELGAVAKHTPVFFARHRPGRCQPANSLAEGKEPDKALAVCAIAQPESFFQSVREVGITVAGALAFPDHARYGQAERAAIAGKIKECGALAVITTQKDLVKMPGDYLGLPLFVLGTVMEIEDDARFWQEVERRAGLVHE